MSWVLHVFSIALWIGGLMVAARLSAGGVSTEARAAVMRWSLWPALALVLLTGTLMIVERGVPAVFQSGGWMHVKLTLVAVLIGLQVWLARAGERNLGWMVLPVGLIGLGVVYLAHVKPF